MKKIFVLILTFSLLAAGCMPVSAAAARESIFSRAAKITGQAMGGVDGISSHKVIVLMYHKLSENPKEWSDFCISPETFESDIKFISEKGYSFYTASELYESAKNGSLNKNAVMITFDDGYSSDYVYALPVLEKYKAKATFFVFGKAVGTEGYLTEEQVKSLSDSPYAEIGNHSYELHTKTIYEVKSTYTDKLGENAAAADFIKNKDFLEKITGKSVTAMSYPNGFYSLYVDYILRENGIKMSFSTQEKVEYIVGTGDFERPLGRYNRGKNTIISRLISVRF